MIRSAKMALILPLLAGAMPAEAKPLPDKAAIASTAQKAMAATGARGLAIAVIDHGKVVSVQSFGARNAKGDPLTPDTVMYGASITKALFGYFVMRLVDEGKVDLDRPIAAMLPKPLPDYGNLDAYGAWGDLAGDDRWRAITPRMTLQHSTGFANFSFLEPDGKLRIHFAPGSRYSYSGEGMILLQFALEQGPGLDMDHELQRLVFDPLDMPRTSLKWRPDFADNLADGWRLDGSVEPHDERSRIRVAGSMDTTITDLANFVAAFVSGTGLGEVARAELVQPQLPIRSATQFPVLQEDAPASEQIEGLSAALGVVTFAGPQGPGFFKSGYNDSTRNMLVCLERGQRCVLLLSNDARAEAASPMILRSILGETGMPWGWIYPGVKFL